MSAPTTRAQSILSRFPRHLALDEAGSLAGEVVATLAEDLGRLTSQLGRVRDAHRFGLCDEQRDLLLLAGLHRLGAQHLDPLERRCADLAGTARDLAGADAAKRDAARAKLRTQLGLLVKPWPRFPGETDDAPAQARLAAAVAALVPYAARQEQQRRILGDIIAVHRQGNGSIGALLEAAATYLGLACERLEHDPDGYWHLATCRDRLRLVQPQAPGTVPAAVTLKPLGDLLALEENPLVLVELAPEPRRDGEQVTINRRGFDPVPVTLVILGVEDRTEQPLVVHVDTGHGVVYDGVVPDGARLSFTAAGRIVLDGVDVSHDGFAFQGGLFAEEGRAHDWDFVFSTGTAEGDAGLHVATFCLALPLADAFAASASFPHAGGAIPPCVLAVGESRLRAFVRAGSFGRRLQPPLVPAPGLDEPALPRTEAGFWDESLFAEVAAAGIMFKLGFSWQEHEPFACRLWIPLRFQALDRPDDLPISERLRGLLDRHRAAGIALSVAYADDRWVLGEGLLRAQDSTAALGTVITGTRLWSAPAT